jgi:hypothetical protein
MNNSKISDYEKDLKKIKHDIRNLRALTNEQKIFLINSSDKDKNDVLDLYNDMIEYVSTILK